MPDAPHRPDSADTVPIDADELRERLAEIYGADAKRSYTPIPDDETPTAPDLDLPCRRCCGDGRCVVATSPTTHAGPRTCPRCKGSKVDPGTPFDAEDPCAGDLT